MQEFFCIGLAKGVYLGLPLGHIDKLIQLQSKDICLIPGIADCWLGVVNYKSSLLWVLDLENFLGVSDKQDKAKSQQNVLILHYSNGNYQKKVALVIKSLEGVIQVAQHQTESLFANNSPVLKNICDGLVRQEEKDIALVKTDLLLEQLSQQSLLPV